MPSSDIPLARDDRADALTPETQADAEQELAMDLAVLIGGGLIVEIDQAGTRRYAVAALDEQA